MQYSLRACLASIILFNLAKIKWNDIDDIDIILFGDSTCMTGYRKKLRLGIKWKPWNSNNEFCRQLCGSQTGWFMKSQMDSLIPSPNNSIKRAQSHLSSSITCILFYFYLWCCTWRPSLQSWTHQPQIFLITTWTTAVAVCDSVNHRPVGNPKKKVWWVQQRVFPQ
jgi:hypothetical protein